MIKQAPRRIDDDSAGFLASLVGDDLALVARIGFGAPRLGPFRRFAARAPRRVGIGRRHAPPAEEKFDEAAAEARLRRGGVAAALVDGRAARIGVFR